MNNLHELIAKSFHLIFRHRCHAVDNIYGHEVTLEQLFTGEFILIHSIFYRRIAVVTCKLKPPSDDLDLELITHTDQQQPLQPMEAMQMEEPIRSGSEPVSSSFLRAQPMVNHLQPLITTACTTCGGSNGTGPAAISPQYAGTFQRLPSCASADDEFIRELVQLCNFHRKSKQELTNLLAKVSMEFENQTCK